METISAFWGSLRQRQKAMRKGLQICFALLLVFLLIAGIASWQYDEPVQKQTRQYWIHDLLSQFVNIPVQDGPITQKFTTAEGTFREFILLFDNYAVTDTATVLVTLEDGSGKELYQWQTPVSALTGEVFTLIGAVEQELHPQECLLRVCLEDGQSGITVRALSKDLVTDGFHPSLGEMTVAGNTQQDTLLYLFQKYETTFSYETVWYTALAVTLAALIFLAWCASPLWQILWEILSALFLLLIGYAGTELLSGNLATIEIRYALVNGLILLGIYLLLKAVGGKLAFYVTALVSLLAGVTNFYVLQFRGSEFLLSDIRSFSTAMSVAGNYEFTFPPVLFTVLLLYACLLLTQAAADIKFPTVYRKTLLIQRSAFLIAGIAAAIVVNTQVRVTPFNYYTPGENFSAYGWWHSNACVLKFSSMEKPADYSDKTVEKLLSEVEAPAAQPTVAQNIIVIMNEAFSDLGTLGQLETNRDYLPFFRSMTENTVTGNLHVPTFGGSTCMSEYEFLTGNATLFMPMGSLPYSQTKLTREEPGMASTLKAQGYYPVAMHPYGPKNWHRDQVYDAMGFEEFLGIDDFQGGDTIRDYISDKANYQKIIEYYEAFQGDRLFVFNVTMQNHGGYDIHNGSVDTSVTSENIPSSEADTYLSLMYESDQALEYLISYFSEVEEPTMIVLFGDHLPALPESFYDALYGKEESQRTDVQRSQRFVTPYMIWTNYDADFAPLGDTSANYLGRQVLEYAGVQLSQYDQFILQQRKKLPVIGRLGLYDANGQYMVHGAATEALMQDYQTMQYLRVEDRSSKHYNIFGISQ